MSQLPDRPSPEVSGPANGRKERKPHQGDRAIICRLVSEKDEWEKREHQMPDGRKITYYAKSLVRDEATMLRPFLSRKMADFTLEAETAISSRLPHGRRLHHWTEETKESGRRNHDELHLTEEDFTKLDGLAAHYRATETDIMLARRKQKKSVEQ